MLLLRPFPLASLLFALLCGDAVGASTEGGAITNTATLHYEVGGQVRRVSSNTTSLTTRQPPTPAQLTFLRLSSSTTAAPIRADGGLCRDSGGGFRPIALPGQSGETNLASVAVEKAAAFRTGELILVQLADGNRDLDMASRETVEVRLTTKDDEEVLRLRETGADTGVFVAPVATVGQSSAARLDCRLSVGVGVSVKASYVDDFYPADIGLAEALVDPYSFVFSTEDGSPVDDATVTLLDDLTGLPATAFGDDGLSEPYPHSVSTGGSVTTAVRTYRFPSGGFRFPLLRAGSYRLRVTPPDAFRSPSTAPAEQLRLLVGPDGETLAIDRSGSYGGAFQVAGPSPIKIDLPIDPLRGTLVLTKGASTVTAALGDFIQYKLMLSNRNRAVEQRDLIVDDTLPAGFRYRPGSLRIDGVTAPDPEISGDGRTLTLRLGTIAAKAGRALSYVAQVGPSTPPGEAIGSAEARAAGGLSRSNRATVGVRITNDLFGNAVTIVGRVVEGQCGVQAARSGVGGVRILLEDGTYVVSDEDGQFHFEGVRPGIHVVQLDLGTLPAGYEAVECMRNTRTAGRAFSQFVDAQGGTLWRSDFFLRRKNGTSDPEVGASPKEGAGGAVESIDWFAERTDGPALLFPTSDHNPRAPATGAVVRHAPGQRVKLTVNGNPADPLNFDGIDTSTDGRIAISRWRALPLSDGENLIRAEVDGIAFESHVHYSNTATRATFVPERSKLVADGINHPVIAVRITDRSGKPVRAGLSGGYRVRPPYTPATQADAQQERQLAGLDRFDPTWQVTGDDGIALIRLQPTTQTGTAELEFDFRFDGQRRADAVRAWLEPAASDWIVVGFAAGTVGFNNLSRNLEKLSDASRAETVKEGQATLYAKGRVTGKWVLTLAYDSRRGKTDLDGRRSLLRVIDPGRYYTVYGDRSAQGYDAASSEKLYLRLERPQFYALFGDYETGLSEAELGAYSRTFTGAKAEYRGDGIAATAFLAETDLNYQRDEIQGNGLSGPYQLSRRDLILNSERVRIEVRDRLRSERVLETKFLSRHIDYDIDYDAGTLLFRQPVLSRDRRFDPVFLVVEYEVQGTTVTYTNAGGRVAIEPVERKLRIGATAVRDETAFGRTHLGAVDVRIRPSDRSEIRLEAAATDSAMAGTNQAYIAEVEHRSETVDAVVYYRRQDSSFGVGQQNRSESGTSKYGVDGRVELTKNLDVGTSVYREDYMNSAAKREAASANIEYRSDRATLRAGIAHVDDSDELGGDATSTLLQLGASQSLLEGKLDLSADADIGIGGDGAQSVDYPTRYRVGAAYALRPDVRLIARHEIANGQGHHGTTTQVGIDAVPWRGARLASTLNQQVIGENGERSYASLGLAQSLLLGERWGLDLSVDGSRTLRGGIGRKDIADPRRQGLTDDFVAFSTGATYRSDLWSWNARLEYRDGSHGDQYGASSSLLRQIRDGVTMSASVRAFRFDQDDGSTSGQLTTDMSIAWRPLGSRWSILEKLELRMDQVKDGVEGGYSSFGGGGLIASGDARSWRIINNIALNRVSGSHADGTLEQRLQFSLFYGSKYVLSRFDAQDFKGYTHLLGLEARLDVATWLDIAMTGSVRHVLSTDSFVFALGPAIGISPLVNAWISLGYNIVGFRDHDFSQARYTREGFYIMMRIKLDQQTPEDLGLAGSKA